MIWLSCRTHLRNSCRGTVPERQCLVVARASAWRDFAPSGSSPSCLRLANPNCLLRIQHTILPPDKAASVTEVSLLIRVSSSLTAGVARLLPGQVGDQTRRGQSPFSLCRIRREATELSRDLAGSDVCLEPSQRGKSGIRHRLRFRIITVSTSKYARKQRGEEINDESGDVAEKTLRRGRKSVHLRDLISDDVTMLRQRAEGFMTGDDDVAVFVGGTGISHSDVTIETLRPMFEKELEGFGEMFRRKSYSKVGAAAFLTRASAGVVGGKLIVCMPGSPDAVRTGLTMMLDEFLPIVREARTSSTTRDGPGEPIPRSLRTS